MKLGTRVETNETAMERRLRRASASQRPRGPTGRLDDKHIEAEVQAIWHARRNFRVDPMRATFGGTTMRGTTANTYGSANLPTLSPSFSAPSLTGDITDRLRQSLMTPITRMSRVDPHLWMQPPASLSSDPPFNSRAHTPLPSLSGHVQPGPGLQPASDASKPNTAAKAGK